MGKSNSPLMTLKDILSRLYSGIGPIPEGYIISIWAELKITDYYTTAGHFYLNTLEIYRLVCFKMDLLKTI